MGINYAKIFNRRGTPQSQPVPGSTQVRNSGGGYSWQMALITAATESEHVIVAFSAASGGYGGQWGGARCVRHELFWRIPLKSQLAHGILPP